MTNVKNETQVEKTVKRELTAAEIAKVSGGVHRPQL